MAFTSGFQNEISVVGSGEIIGNVGVVSSYNTFEDGIVAGLFGKYVADTNELDKIDGKADSIVAGVVRRTIGKAIEDGEGYTTDNTITVDSVESGIITVEVVAGVVPNKFDKVYVYNNTNTATTEWGKATNHETDKDSGGNDVANLPVDGYFYKEISDSVWAIRIR